MTITQDIIHSIFTGIGTAIGLTIHDLYIKHQLQKLHKKTNPQQKEETNNANH